ncbi:hypothetical protein J132_01021 [Termitomyces sp. J132]|nr:hypothetical protein J132_01021 [Termitomyces sp. J132]
MNREEFVALTIFTSYFAIIIALFVLILTRLYDSPSRHERRRTRWVFKLLAIGSLAHTWRHMFSFLVWSFRSYEDSLGQETSGLPKMTRLTSWLIGSSLFEQAWAAVCFGPFNWWWSQQLCLYTVGAWTVFLVVKGREHGVRHIWAYMLLGQLVAISVASNLFYLALILRPTTPDPKLRKSKDAMLAAPASLYIPVFLSLATVMYSPHTTVQDRTFLCNLLAMHALTFIPLITPPISGPLPRISFGALTAFLSLLSFMLHVRASLHALHSISLNDGEISSLRTWTTFASNAWNVLHAHHPAQSSIGWDVVWTILSLSVWSTVTQSQNALSLTTSFLFSVGSVAPWIFNCSGVERPPKRTRKS